METRLKNIKAETLSKQDTLKSSEHKKYSSVQASVENKAETGFNSSGRRLAGLGHKP